MKPTLTQLLHLFMAVVVLFSSTGFGLVEHSCQMRGKKQRVVSAFSMVQLKGCTSADMQAQSPPDGQATLSRDACCQDHLSYKHVDTGSSLAQLLAKCIQTAAEAVMQSVVSVVTYLVSWLTHQQSTLAGSDTSPPFSYSGRSILILIQSFLI